MNTTTTTSPADIDTARDAGYQSGHNAGTWVAINSNLDAMRILQGYEDGWPEIMDLCPSPLSGEWGGESIPELSAEHGIDLWDDAIADTFEGAFNDGFWDEVTRAARYQVTGESDLA